MLAPEFRRGTVRLSDNESLVGDEQCFVVVEAMSSLEANHSIAYRALLDCWAAILEKDSEQVREIEYEQPAGAQGLATLCERISPDDRRREIGEAAVDADHEIGGGDVIRERTNVGEAANANVGILQRPGALRRIRGILGVRLQTKHVPAPRSERWEKASDPTADIDDARH
ncbi:MAG TPA: hypothetical protein VGP25_13865 [Gemmatimonadaceae bacterium]|nr:hypothetical protein [Gemmatimonadaceae bacterium]